MDECECDRDRRRLELREWKSVDINPNRRRGVSAPSARSPGGLDGLAGLRAPGEVRGMAGTCGVTTRTVGRGEVGPGLEAAETGLALRLGEPVNAGEPAAETILAFVGGASVAGDTGDAGPREGEVGSGGTSSGCSR